MMFEGRIQIPIGREEGEGKALRALAWSDLVARLDAARDLRHALRQDLPFGGASFCDAAAGFFTHPGHGKPDVNPDALSDLKSDAVMSEFAEDDAAIGDKEN